ncbi:MAG: YdeI/OmpD-associated family protein [Brevundimonas sp.]
MVVDPARVREFADFQTFHDWLAQHHEHEPEIWIKMHKKGSGLASIDWGQAVDAALCWGWIDGVRKSLDGRSFLQRLTPRGPKSSWSKINVDKVAALTTAGVMTGHGLKHVEAAKADGRWDAAYRVKDAVVPADLQAAIDADPKARAMFAVLSSRNRFALIFRTGQMKTVAGRARKIFELTDGLARGETPHPQKAKP